MDAKGICSWKDKIMYFFKVKTLTCSNKALLYKDEVKASAHQTETICVSTPRTLAREVCPPFGFRIIWCYCSLLCDLGHRVYSLPSSVDFRCVKQIDAIVIGQSHQLLSRLLTDQGTRKREGKDGNTDVRC